MKKKISVGEMSDALYFVEQIKRVVNSRGAIKTGLIDRENLIKPLQQLELLVTVTDLANKKAKGAK